jgi:cobalt-zinc-cadmium efflux system membrane fusion protein
LVWLAGCANEPAKQGAAAPAPVKEPPPKEQVVTLDAASLKEARLRVVAVESRSVPMTIRANGRMTTNENTTWRVGAITEGRIIQVNAKVGDAVEKGQIIARMHSHDIHESRAEYRKAMANLARSKSNLDYARRTRDRVRRLYEMKAASLEQVEQAENLLKNEQNLVAEAEIEAARTRNHLVEFLEVPLEVPPEHPAGTGPEVHSEDLIPIRAVATGVVLTRNVTQGAVVSSSSDLFVICDLSSIWTIASVQEESLARIRVGMPALVTVQAYPERSFRGRVIKIDEKLDAETRTVPVRVEIDNRQGLLKPEMYATVELDAGGSAPGLFVPQGAVQDVNGQSTVFVERTPGTYEPRAVLTGRVLDGRAEVLRGVAAGESVVAEGSFILKSQLLKSSMSGE